MLAWLYIFSILFLPGKVLLKILLSGQNQNAMEGKGNSQLRISRGPSCVYFKCIKLMNFAFRKQTINHKGVSRKDGKKSKGHIKQLECFPDSCVDSIQQILKQDHRLIDDKLG